MGDRFAGRPRTALDLMTINDLWQVTLSEAAKVQHLEVQRLSAFHSKCQVPAALSRSSGSVPQVGLTGMPKTPSGLRPEGEMMPRILDPDAAV